MKQNENPINNTKESLLVGINEKLIIREKTTNKILRTNTRGKNDTK